MVVGEFVDKVSADDLRGRRAWRNLLEMALKRDVDLIVVWRLDRAFRSVVDGATAWAQLEKRQLTEPVKAGMESGTKCGRQAR